MTIAPGNDGGGAVAGMELAPVPDAGRLADFLGDRLPQLGRPLRLARLPGGQSNPTFLVRSDRGTAILRMKPAPAQLLLPSAHAIEREFAVLRALATTDFPVPVPQVLCEDEAVLGAAFYLMEHVDGRVLRDASLPSMSKRERAEIYDELNRVIALLHDIDPAAIGLAGFGAPGAYLDRQIRRWSRQYRASETEVDESMERLLEWLPQRAPECGERRIVHGDFRMENVIFDHQRARILAVLDWELATVGDPLADFAYHCLPWHMPPGEAKGIEGLDHAALGIPGEVAYRASYAKRTGRRVDAAWPVYIAFNFFRLAAILQGVHKRALAGQATSAAASRAGVRARAMAARGWLHAQRY